MYFQTVAYNTLLSATTSSSTSTNKATSKPATSRKKKYERFHRYVTSGHLNLVKGTGRGRRHGNSPGQIEHYSAKKHLNRVRGDENVHQLINGSKKINGITKGCNLTDGQRRHGRPRPRPPLNTKRTSSLSPDLNGQTNQLRGQMPVKGHTQSFVPP